MTFEKGSPCQVTGPQSTFLCRDSWMVSMLDRSMPMRSVRTVSYETARRSEWCSWRLTPYICYSVIIDQDAEPFQFNAVKANFLADAESNEHGV